ncbi:glutamine synthetase adenylyltransferase [Microbacterium sp. HM58-2]|nr:glutamine synthetase adenylyltransferase [Microbacterium sp. HM58-2]
MTTRAERAGRADRPRRPLLRSFRFWVPVGILLVLIALAAVTVVVGQRVYDRAMAAKDSLEQAMPLATTVKDQILGGDPESAQGTAAQLAALTADAREQTDDETWKNLEWVPVVGPNLYAVRTAAAVTDDLVADALTPATTLSVNALKPVNGAIDLAAVAGMQDTVTQAADAVAKAADDLDSIDREALIPQVEGALSKLTDAVDEMQPMLGPAKDIIGILPTALGAEGPRNYLMIFQNNAESRGTGGNPAALVLITADQGRISISQQASSADFKNARPEPIVPLNPETVALYGDKMGRWISDATLSPDFSETVAVVRAYWAESFGTPVDAVVSFDPVALSYLLRATGPTVIPAATAEYQGMEIEVLDEPVTLTADNAVPTLLNEAYWKYPEGYLQDAFFAAAAKSVFDGLTSGKAEPKALLEALAQAVEEDRLLYSPATEEEAALVGESKLSGKLPSTNTDRTLLGVYVNDFTQSKLDYYMQLDLAATSTQCTAPDSPTFATTATLTNTVTPDQAPDLPYHIAPGKYFPKGHVATDLVFYGPVGSTLTGVTVDGKAVSERAVQHLGRGAVKVDIYNEPGQTHTVVATFTGAAGEYGPLDLQHTPMVRPVGETLTAEGCG